MGYSTYTFFVMEILHKNNEFKSEKRYKISPSYGKIVVMVLKVLSLKADIIDYSLHDDVTLLMSLISIVENGGVLMTPHDKVPNHVMLSTRKMSMSIDTKINDVKGSY